MREFSLEHYDLVKAVQTVIYERDQLRSDLDSLMKTHADNRLILSQALEELAQMKAQLNLAVDTLEQILAGYMVSFSSHDIVSYFKSCITTSANTLSEVGPAVK